MSLGEAFVEIHADLRPFGRELRRNVRPMVEAFERELNNATGRALLNNSEEHGRRAGDRVSQGIKKSLTHQFANKNAFVVIASSLASALDDGISALPTEVKAAIVAGILAASPLVAGALAGAVSAGLGVATAGIGILLASQFEQVQTRATEFGRRIRQDLVSSADAFVPAIFDAFDMIEARTRRLRPLLDQIFDVSAGFLEPLVEGGLDALESLTQAIFDSLDDIQPFIDELGAGIAVLGDAIATALQILVATGEDGRKALRDLIGIVAIAVVAFASLLFALTKVYGAIRTIIQILDQLLGPFASWIGVVAKFFQEIDERTNNLKSFNNTNTDAIGIFDGLIAATDGETQALKEYRDALDRASNATKNQLELSIQWEESLDRIRDGLDKNGKTLDITTEKGRENVSNFLDAIKVAEDAAVQRVRRGEQTGEQAALAYDAEIAKLREIARVNGITEQQFNDIFGAITQIGAARISATEMGIDNLSGELSTAEDAARELLATLQTIQNLRRNIGLGGVAGVRNFAEGGILHLPETINVAEAGPEAIIPLTKPARAAQLLQQSGLSSLLGSGGPSQILVFIGNEQLDTRMVRIVERSNQLQAMALSNGGRQF